MQLCGTIRVLITNQLFMERKTPGYLNGKTWYRFIKVLFFICLIIILGIYNYIVFSNGVKNVDLDNTIIKCNVFNKISFSPASINIKLKNSDFVNDYNLVNPPLNYKNYFEGYNDNAIMSIFKGCAGQDSTKLQTISTNGDIYDNQKSGEIVNKYGLIGEKTKTQDQLNSLNNDWNIYKKETANLYGNLKTQYLDYNFHMFDITPVFTYSSFINLFIFGNAIILVIFEIIRRIFYYVILGKINPK